MNTHSAAASQTDYDLIIVGGGLVGASLALSLAGQPLRVALIEAVPPRTTTTPAYDDRAIALSYGSRRILDALGLWEALAPQVAPIQQIHVSEQGRFGFTRLSAAEESVDALGYVITARALGQCLLGRLEHAAPNQNLTLLCPASVSGVEFADQHASVTLARDDRHETLRARLIVAADGGHSALRHRLGIAVAEHDYGQTALVANLTPARPHGNRAFERFTPQGPLALLPLTAQDHEPRLALVWTRAPAEAQRLLALDDAAFLTELQACFGQRLGRLLKVGRRQAHALTLIRADEQVRARLALIGNAAHTLHPIAGQGLNLSLRDVVALAQCVIDAQRRGADIGNLATLETYRTWRARDQRQVIGFTDLLVQGFSNEFAPLALARNLGLLALDLLPPLKHTLARHAMGLAGKLPRLARGLPL